MEVEVEMRGGKAGESKVECGVNQIKRQLRVMRVGDIMKVDIVQLVLPEVCLLVLVKYRSISDSIAIESIIFSLYLHMANPTTGLDAQPGKRNYLRKKVQQHAPPMQIGIDGREI